jgi:hypothetical protein
MKAFLHNLLLTDLDKEWRTEKLSTLHLVRDTD